MNGEPLDVSTGQWVHWARARIVSLSTDLELMRKENQFLKSMNGKLKSQISRMEAQPSKPEMEYKGRPDKV